MDTGLVLVQLAGGDSWQRLARPGTKTKQSHEENINVIIPSTRLSLSTLWMSLCLLIQQESSKNIESRNSEQKQCNKLYGS